MVVMISGYPFDGPFKDADHLLDKSGVYVMLDSAAIDQPRVLSVDDSKDIRKDILRNSSNSQFRYISFAAIYLDSVKQMQEVKDKVKLGTSF